MNPLVFPSQCHYVASTAGIQKTSIFPNGKSTTWESGTQNEVEQLEMDLDAKVSHVLSKIFWGSGWL